MQFFFAYSFLFDLPHSNLNPIDSTSEKGDTPLRNSQDVSGMCLLSNIRTQSLLNWFQNGRLRWESITEHKTNWVTPITNQSILLNVQGINCIVFPMSVVGRKQCNNCINRRKGRHCWRSSTQWSFGGIQARTGEKCRVAKATVWELSVFLFCRLGFLFLFQTQQMQLAISTHTEQRLVATKSKHLRGNHQRKRGREERKGSKPE